MTSIYYEILQLASFVALKISIFLTGNELVFC